MGWSPALKKDKTSSQNLASAALSYTTDYARRVKIEAVLIHASVVITETVKVILDSANGSNYDEVIDQYDLVGEQDFVWRPQGEMNLQSGDEIKVTCTNANTTGTVYLSIKASEILT